MASYQRVALFILFDSIEKDLTHHIRNFCIPSISLSSDEKEKAVRRLSAKSDNVYNLSDDFDLLYGLDIAEKFQVLMRCKGDMDQISKDYFKSVHAQMMKSVSVRNDIMHGRPLTVDEHVFALSFAQGLLGTPDFWPTLKDVYKEYTENPATFLQKSIQFLDDESSYEVLHNLPVPDYDDTGYLTRPELEKDLKKKILGRHPVVTVLGEGGNGKTALVLRVLYGLVSSNDHGFDAIIWVSAKTSELLITGVREITASATNAVDLMDIAAALEIKGDTPQDRLTNLLSENKILLVVDNYETVIGSEIADFAEQVPGESKLLFTSRKPVGSDLTVTVGEFSEAEARIYIRRLIDAYSIETLRNADQSDLDRYLKLLSYKPLLIKWFALGVHSGLQPERIVSSPKVALRFCLDNVVLMLGPEAQAVIVVLATLPSRVAPGVIAHVAKLSPTQVVDGLVELSRVGLLETEAAVEGRQLFGLRSFARTYVHRLISPDPEITGRILSNYRQLEVEYQYARAETKPTLFRMKNFKIESRAQLLAVRKLREAMYLSRSGNFDDAEMYLKEGKSIEPTYFEAHRVEAVVALNQNDWSRARAAYETAINLAPDEPQLHFFYAGLLMRINENDLAAKEFGKAIELAPEDAIVHREAARNEMMRCEFAEAQKLLSIAIALDSPIEQERVKLLDLQLQIYGREMEYEIRGDRYERAESSANRMFEYLSQINIKDVDKTFVDHISKYAPCFLRLKEKVDGTIATSLIDMLGEKFGGEISTNANSGSQRLKGYLKIEGRKPHYGFLSSSSTDDAFVHVTDVSPDTWVWLLEGGEVEFEKLPGERGKAIHVRKLEG